MLVRPVSTARTSPAIESTIATLVLLDRHWNVAAPVSGGHGRKLALARKESPTCSVADGGLTVGPGRRQSGVACTLFVPSQLHAPMHSPSADRGKQDSHTGLKIGNCATEPEDSPAR